MFSDFYVKEDFEANWFQNRNENDGILIDVLPSDK